jgi:hypothetical protein
VRRLRQTWLKNTRRITTAPRDAEIIVVSPKAGPRGTVDHFRVVDDPDAYAVARTDFDVTHPYRQTELINVINERVGQHAVGPYEILCVRRVYKIDERPEYFHRPKFGSPQYSAALVSWLVEQFERDPGFFEAAKQAARPRRESTP